MTSPPRSAGRSGWGQLVRHPSLAWRVARGTSLHLRAELGQRPSAATRSHLAGRFSFAEALARRVQAAPDAPLLRTQTGTYSARQCESAANRFAHFLLETGSVSDSRVALMLDNQPLYLDAYLALQKLGAVALRVDVGLRDAGLQRVLHQARVAVLVIDRRFVPQLEKVLPSLPALREILVHEDGSDSELNDPRVRSLEAASLAKLPDSSPPLAQRRSNLLEIKYTSGTTGAPKAVRVRDDAPSLRGLPLYSRIVYRRDDVIWSCLPLHHDVALWMAFGAALWCGAEFALAPRFSASKFWQQVQASGATRLHATGAMIAILLRQPPQAEERDHQVRSVIASGCPQQLWRAFERRFGLRLWEGYGASDGGAFGALNFGHAPPGSIGRPFQRYAIVDERDHPVAPGEVGELIFYLGKQRTPERTVEYAGDPEASQAKRRDGWLRTGDRVRADVRGHLFFAGRLDDSIRCGGENVSADEVESAACAHPVVHECAAYPVPSPLAGDDVMLAVVLRPGSEVNARSLSSFLEARLPRRARPRHLRFLSDLPRNASQKLDRKALIAAGITSDTFTNPRTVARISETHRGER